MTPARRELLEILAELSTLYPEMRMGQWMTAFACAARGSTVESIYDAEDEELLPAARTYLKNRKADAAAARAEAS